MRSLISEFSYGFALTHELVLSLETLSAAPIFPSLLEEGRAGGGYDVKLTAPGVALFLQFKRSERLHLKSAREIRDGARIGLPYYRLEITAKSDSDQHNMLLELDQPPNQVYYAAPMFILKPEFDNAFVAGLMRQRSFFIKPQDVGRFTDAKPHHVSFDTATCIVKSEPREIKGYGIAELEGLFRRSRPLRLKSVVSFPTMPGPGGDLC